MQSLQVKFLGDRVKFVVPVLIFSPVGFRTCELLRKRTPRIVAFTLQNCDLPSGSIMVKRFSKKKPTPHCMQDPKSFLDSAARGLPQHVIRTHLSAKKDRHFDRLAVAANSWVRIVHAF